MQPGFDLRLRTMIKALAETVLPAVDANNKAALEQLQITIGSLHLLQQQIDYAHWYEVVDAQSMADLLAQIGPFCGQGNEQAQRVAAETRALAARHDVTLTTLRDANHQLREVISAAIEQAAVSGNAEASSRVQALVLKHSEDQIRRERAFVAGTKFDAFPDTLLSIEESLRNAKIQVSPHA